MTKYDAFLYASSDEKHQWMRWSVYRQKGMAKTLWALYYKVLAKNGGVR